MTSHRSDSPPSTLPAPCRRCAARSALAAALARADVAGRAAGWSRCGERRRDRGAASPSAPPMRDDGLLWLELPLAGDAPLPRPLAASSRPRRACSARLRSARHRDRGRRSAPWLRHGAWPQRSFPLRRDSMPSPRCSRGSDDYPFVRVEGDGVHEIPVGPVHAGIIEPGHFRFSVVGEKVLRLEQRLGYVAQGHRAALHRLAPLDGAPPRRPRVGRLDRRLRLGLLHGARSGRRRCTIPPRARGCARCCSSASASPTTSATSARSATTPASPSAWRSSRACKEDWLRARRTLSVTA